jgi:Bacterial transglutaminase-like N-terminal region
LRSAPDTMKLHIEHETNFTYAQPVCEAVSQARLRPRNDGQRLLGFQLALDPPTPLDMIADHFGNAIHCYSVLPPYQRGRDQRRAVDRCAAADAGGGHGADTDAPSTRAARTSRAVLTFRPLPRQCWPSGAACARTSRPADRAVLQPGPVGALRQRLFVQFRQLSEAILASHAWTEVFLEGRGWDST